MTRHFGLVDRIKAWQAGIVGWLISTVWACPHFYRWNLADMNTTRIGDYLRLCAHPLTRELNEPIVAYRLTLPLIAWLLHLPTVGALALPVLCDMAFLAVAFAAVKRRTDGLTASLAVIVLALSWSVFSSNLMPGEFPDCVSHLCAAGLLLTLNPWVAFTATTLGLLNDERLLLALPFVALWHLGPGKLSLNSKALRWAPGAILAGVACYAALRFCLKVGVIGPGIVEPVVYNKIARRFAEFRPYIGSWRVWALEVIACFRWGWLLVIGYAAALMLRQRWLMFAAYVGAVLAATVASSFVIDICRSVGFIAPALLLAIVDRDPRSPAPSKLLYAVAAALLITPAFSFSDRGGIAYELPLPLSLYRSTFSPPRKAGTGQTDRTAAERAVPPVAPARS